MYRLTDNELVEELQKRLNENKKALNDLRIVTKKLDTVNKKLRESEEMKSNFLSNIRNEIVNPLTSIIALAMQVADHYKEDANLFTTANMIHSEAFNLDFQLRNIFAAAEIEAGETVLSVSKVDVESLVKGIIKSFGHQCTAKKLNVSLSCECVGCDEHDMYFKTDSEKLQLVLSNLLCNALEFSREGKSVDIHMVKHDDMLTVDIKDSCPGINKTDEEKIFDRFRQAEEGMCKSHKGQGLGLSITKFLVDFLHGSMNFSNINNKGCVFTINIPEVETKEDVDVISEDGNEFIFEEDEEVL